MPTPENPLFYEQNTHEFLRYLDKRIESKRALLDAGNESHRPLIKSELAELRLVRAHFEHLLGADRAEPRHTWIVMADNGIGEFLWYRRKTYPEGYRANAGSLMDHASVDGRISNGLWDQFRAWARWYMEGDSRGNWAAFDWDRFNAEGRRLAECLREESGPGVRVMYCSAYMDSQRRDESCEEIAPPRS